MATITLPADGQQNWGPIERAAILAVNDAAAAAQATADTALTLAGGGGTIPDPTTDPVPAISAPLMFPGFDSASSTTATIQVPASATVGALAVVGVCGNGTAITAPSGWTLVSPVVVTGATQVFGVYRRVIVANDLGLPFTWSGFTANRVSAIGFAITGQDATTIIDSAPAPAGAAGALVDNLVIPSVDVTRVGGLLVSYAMGSTATGDITTPQGMTKVVGTSGAGRRAAFAVETRNTQGQSGTRTWTTDPFQTIYMGGLNFVIRPSGGTNPPPGPTVITPTAGFLADPLTGVASLAVSFVDTSGNTPTSWAWTFGDGGTSTSQNPSHTYTAAGTYTATLVATNSAGSNTATRTITVTAATTPIAMASNGLSENAAATSIAVTLPTVTSTQVAVVTVAASSAAITAAAGWTQVALSTDATPLATGVYYRVGAGASGTHTWSGLTSGRVTACWQVFDAVNTTTPMDVTAVTATSGGVAASITVPSITTVTDGAILCHAVSVNSGPAVDLVIPTGMTEINGSTGTGRRHSLATESRASAGATGTRLWNEIPTTTLLAFTSVAFALRPANPSASPTPGAPNRGALLWSDEFNGTAGTLPDSTKWTFEYNGGPQAFGGGTFNGRNSELQNYTNADTDNCSLDGQGNLKISVIAESSGGRNWSSASIHTNGKYTFQYGYIEFRAKTPKGSGVWPALWLEGSTGTWPTHGEIDTMEQINLDDGTNCNVHGGPTHWDVYHYNSTPPRDPNTWHLYATRISPGKVEFYLDNALMHTVTTGNMPSGQTWPYDGLYQQFIRMNVAMGGGWPGTPDGSQPNPMSMIVDYVRVYEYQPSTTPTNPSDMPASTGSEVLVNRVVGVTAEDGTVRVKTRTTGLGTSGKVRLKVGTDTAVTTGVVYTAPLTPSALGDAIHVITGLTRGTTYYYRVQMNSTTDSSSIVGRIICFPTAASTFAFNFGSCSSVNDPAVFAPIKTRNDQLFIHLGDFWYADGTGANIDNFRNQFNTKLNATNQSSVYATTPMAYIPSDHDCAMVNNGLGADQPAALALYNQAYRENIPAPLVATTSGVYHTFTYGRVRFIMLDTRTFKSTAGATDNASKTMLGTTQKAWLKNVIATSTSKIHIIASDVPWTGPTTVGADDWGGYNTERVEIGNAIIAAGLQAVFITGDMHAVGHSSGATYGKGIPDLAAAPFSQNSSIKAAPWDAVYPASGSTLVNQYGRIVITDTNSTTITLAFTGYSADNTSRVTKPITFNV